MRSSRRRTLNVRPESESSESLSSIMMVWTGLREVAVVARFEDDDTAAPVTLRPPAPERCDGASSSL